MSAAELDLDAIEARANAATAGPWHPHTTYPHTVWQGDMYGEDPGMISTTLAQEIVADAKFIAAARTDVPALVAEVRRLRAVLANHDPMPGFPCDNGHCPCRSNVGATG